jgi:DNA-binding NarL/FixJ family response regulator
MPGGGGDHSSRRAIFEARERERKIVELVLRGATYEQVGRQLNIHPSTVCKAWQRAMTRLPKSDIEAMRTMQSERLQRLRGKAWSEMSGRTDPTDPTRIIPLSPELLNNYINTALKIEARDAALHGLDAPTRQQIVATALVGSALLDQELDRGLDRLSADEQREFIRLQLKIEGRLIEAETPPADAESSEPESSDPGMAEPAIDERTFKKSG